MKRLNNLPILKNRRIELRQTSTKQENQLWHQIRRSKLKFKFRRQHSIGPYILDFYCPEKGLAIEVDGSQHLKNKEYDKERENFLHSLGIVTLRFWNKDIDADIVRIMKEIRNKLNTLRPAKGEVSEGRRG